MSEQKQEPLTTKEKRVLGAFCCILGAMIICATLWLFWPWASPVDRVQFADACQYDFDGDGIITVVDIMYVSARWHQVCEMEQVPLGPQGVCYCGGQAEDVMRLADWGVRAGLQEVPGVNVTIPQLITVDGAITYTEADIRQYARTHPGSTWLVFGEPDQPGCDDLTPKEGAYLYRALTGIVLSEDQMASFLCCGVSQLNDQTWENSFIAEYEAVFGEPPQVDGWATHFYPAAEGGVASAEVYVQRLQAYITQYQAWANAPVWLTEWSLLNDDAKAVLYIEQATPWLQSQGVRYSWWCTDLTYFGTGGSLLYLSGGLTPLGEMYKK